jgi:hypothetical protein
MKEERKVVEGEFAPSAPVVTPEVVCEVRVGLNADGSVFFYIYGTNQNLITIAGLHDYFGQRKDQMWENLIKGKE